MDRREDYPQPERVGEGRKLTSHRAGSSHRTSFSLAQCRWLNRKRPGVRSPLEYYSDMQSAALAAAELSAIEDLLARLDAYLDSFSALWRNPRVKQSCLLGNLTQELALTHSAMRALCDAHFTGRVAFLSRCLDEQRRVIHRNEISIRRAWASTSLR